MRPLLEDSLKQVRGFDCQSLLNVELSLMARVILSKSSSSRVLALEHILSPGEINFRAGFPQVFPDAMILCAKELRLRSAWSSLHLRSPPGGSSHGRLRNLVAGDVKLTACREVIQFD